MLQDSHWGNVLFGCKYLLWNFRENPDIFLSNHVFNQSLTEENLHTCMIGQNCNFNIGFIASNPPTL